ncbi:3-glucan binding protein [Entomophthora muscae]|uniref:3-glucan binding protein n=1 Tax=Entomophthora muscae TaxID=34485 RepID=A0ACC2TPB6_9FUNG|nr:3-glucan binding protein [Entomophthora muscae]
MLGLSIGDKSKYRQKQYARPKYPGRFNKLAFKDTFSKLDMNKWRPEITAGGGGNWEFQFYNNDRRTSFVEDNVLYIKPMLTMDYLGMDVEKFLKEGGLNLWGNTPGMQCTANGFYGCERSTQGDNIVNPIMSAQLRTVNSFNFRYGRVEIEAKLPRGDWIWPAIWLMPKHHAYGGWPASGEIDIVEARGNSDNCHGDGISTVASTLHWGTHWSKSMYELTTGKAKSGGADFSRKFTKFTLEWTEEHIRTLADGKVILDVRFDEPFFKRGNYSKTEFNPWANSEKSRKNARLTKSSTSSSMSPLVASTASFPIPQGTADVPPRSPGRTLTKALPRTSSTPETNGSRHGPTQMTLTLQHWQSRASKSTLNENLIIYQSR